MCVVRGSSAAVFAAAISAAGLACSPPSVVAGQERVIGRPLYSLQTDCLVAGKAERCQVKVFDGIGTTVYRTSVGGQNISFRLIDTAGLRGAQLWDKQQNGWIGLNRLSLNFTTNQLCINGQVLCMVNPNYFASLRQDYPNLQTDLIVSRFSAKDGRLGAICYSQEACDAGF